MTDEEIKALAGELAYVSTATPQRAEVFVRLAAARGIEEEHILAMARAFRYDFDLMTAYVLMLAGLERDLLEGAGDGLKGRGILSTEPPRRRPIGELSPEKVGEIFGLPVYVDPDLPPNTAIFGPPAPPAYGIVNRAARRRRG